MLGKNSSDTIDIQFDCRGDHIPDNFLLVFIDRREENQLPPPRSHYKNQ